MEHRYSAVWIGTCGIESRHWADPGVPLLTADDGSRTVQPSFVVGGQQQCNLELHNAELGAQEEAQCLCLPPSAWSHRWRDDEVLPHPKRVKLRGLFDKSASVEPISNIGSTPPLSETRVLSWGESLSRSCSVYLMCVDFWSMTPRVGFVCMFTKVKNIFPLAIVRSCESTVVSNFWVCLFSFKKKKKRRRKTIQRSLVFCFWRHPFFRRFSVCQAWQVSQPLGWTMSREKGSCRELRDKNSLGHGLVKVLLFTSVFPWFPEWFAWFIWRKIFYLRDS